MMNEAEILQYINDNNLNAFKTASGLYYVIDMAGGINKPTLCDNVTVVYSGYLTNGDVFDASDAEGASFGLSNVILGWQEGIPLFGEGGKGKLLVPSKLAYSVNPPSSAIPVNAVLIFDIELLQIN
jgi:FKBP-type peptidyl-prolyl cis-trans isomerase FkpA